MPHVLTLELPDDVYQPLQQAAAREGLDLKTWALARLRSAAPTPEERSAALARLLRHAGAADLGRPTGLDNAGIDADLAREYGGTHEG